LAKEDKWSFPLKRGSISTKPGELLPVIGDRDKGGIGLVKADAMKEFVIKVLKGLGDRKKKNENQG